MVVCHTTIKCTQNKFIIIILHKSGVLIGFDRRFYTFHIIYEQYIDY